MLCPYPAIIGIFQKVKLLRKLVFLAEINNKVKMKKIARYLIFYFSYYLHMTIAIKHYLVVMEAANGPNMHPVGLFELPASVLTGRGCIPNSPNSLLLVPLEMVSPGNPHTDARDGLKI